ncbi:MAG: NAD(P)H-binding protein [Burkholderiales bacterium]
MEKLLIIGPGDIAKRALPALLARYQVYALVRDQHAAEQLASAGVGPIVGDLDRPDTLAPLRGLADRIVHLAPPPDTGTLDTRTTNLLNAIAPRKTSGAMVAQRADDALSRAPAKLPRRIVYISTSGVYGDCAGARVDETHNINPKTDRARRRVHAEVAVCEWGTHHFISLAVLRVPGIYAADRLPIDRLRAGTPALRPEDDVYTNHIHADDLAAIVVTALERESAYGVFNIADDSEMKMGEYFDLVAERNGIPKPPRIARSEAPGRMSPMLLSFMSESRRLDNTRMKETLGIRLRYPTVNDGVPPR